MKPTMGHLWRQRELGVDEWPEGTVVRGTMDDDPVDNWVQRTFVRRGRRWACTHATREVGWLPLFSLDSGSDWPPLSDLAMVVHVGDASSTSSLRGSAEMERAEEVERRFSEVLGEVVRKVVREELGRVDDPSSPVVGRYPTEFLESRCVNAFVEVLREEMDRRFGPATPDVWYIEGLDFDGRWVSLRVVEDVPRHASPAQKLYWTTEGYPERVFTREEAEGYVWTHRYVRDTVRLVPATEEATIRRKANT